MKYIIIILLVILIVIFIAKKSIEYRNEKLEQVCDFNCGIHQTEGACLSCKNCGVCKLTDDGKIYTYCYPGDKNGSFFNEQCKGTAWTFHGETLEKSSQPTITLDNKPRDYKVTQTSSYEDVLKGIGQQVTEKNIVTDNTTRLGTIFIEEEIGEETEKKIGVSNIDTQQKSYNDILAELEKLSKFFN